ncbi:hypothetical protein H632_c1573p0 [Helicosporidium sp. ATCC 50920]|nr:hypothetical protein H632_c1573p0 [Helicosporidium sp. ATCC 50920]|eukprot:KDD74099.1 hypothetical protein H632_c1573p0 [Helicosporidium sp. ATCC 50920]
MFIFNELGAIPLEAQRAGLGPDRSVVWDYHVVLLEERDLGSTLVWDLDSTLPLPSPLSEYARRTFDPEADDTSQEAVPTRSATF